MSHACTRCDNRWDGLNTCHCGACHQTFTSLRGFDTHRRNATCAAPERVGLVLADRKYRCWGEKPSESAWWEKRQ